MFRGSGGIRQAVLRGGPPVSGARVGRSPESGKPFQGVFVLKTLPEPGGARLRSDAGAAAARLCAGTWGWPAGTFNHKDALIL